jgi:hypothetical protein
MNSAGLICYCSLNMCLRRSILNIPSSHFIPISPFFSYSSVAQPAFLGPPRRSKLQNNTLGKRPRSYRDSPRSSEEQPHKRPRHNAPEGYACSDRERKPSTPPPRAQPWHQNDRFVRKFNQKELARAVTTVSPPFHLRLLSSRSEMTSNSPSIPPSAR